MGTIKTKQRTGSSTLSFAQNMMCAVASSSLAVPMQIPFDTVKIGMISESWKNGGKNRLYSSSMEGLRKILAPKKLRSFWARYAKVFGSAYLRTTVATVSGYAS